MISALILASNEERDLAGALKSLEGLASEVVVVDSGSVDSTVEIARRSGAKVVSRPFDNFTQQRSFGLSHCSGSWILSLDADERVTEELSREISAVLHSSSLEGYEIPFEIEFMGRILKFSGRQRERHLRLFRKDAVEMKAALSVHEQYRIRGRAGRLAGKIRHRPYADLAEYMAKCELYTDLAARDFVAKGKHLSFRYRLIPAYEFFRTYVAYLGFLDGFPGLVWSALSAYHRYMRYEKVRRLQRVA